MLRLFIFLFFKLINKSYEEISQESLAKFISKENLIQDIIDKKNFFNKWRKRLNTHITNEKDIVKKLSFIKKKNGIILRVNTIHSFKIHSSNNSKKSLETLSYVFFISKFKIIDMAIYEYDPEKYKKMLFCNSELYNPPERSYLWSNLISNFDIILNSYSNYINKNNTYNLYRTDKLYDRKKAVLYAQKYALNYNSSYTDFSHNGGDCTNFISQCLNAGGLPLSNMWKPYSLPWIRVNELYYFLTRNNFAQDSDSLTELKKGDLIQFFSNSKGFFAHSGIITDILENGEILYSCHTFDKLNFPLSEIYPYLYTKLRLVKISF